MTFNPNVSCRVEAIARFRDVEEQHNYRMDVWDWFVKQRQQDLDPVRSRPDFEVEAQTRLVYMDPLFDCGTGSYTDVTRILEAMRREVVIPNEMGACVVSGDGQTYKMILNILRNNKATGMYDWVIPEPGEWHFMVHALMTIHADWWSVLGLFVHNLGYCEKTVIEDWDSVSKFNSYRYFWEVIITATLALVVEIVPAMFLREPLLLMEVVGENKSDILCIFPVRVENLSSRPKLSF